MRPFPAVNSGEWQVFSINGGTAPIWARSGGELFYLGGVSGHDALHVVPIQTRLNNSSAFSYGTPTKLLDSDGRWSVSGVDSRPYDVSLDGPRLLTIKNAIAPDEAATAPPGSLVVVLNWSEDLKQRVPTR